MMWCSRYLITNNFCNVYFRNASEFFLIIAVHRDNKYAFVDIEQISESRHDLDIISNKSKNRSCIWHVISVFIFANFKSFQKSRKMIALSSCSVEDNRSNDLTRSLRWVTHRLIFDIKNFHGGRKERERKRQIS